MHTYIYIEAPNVLASFPAYIVCSTALRFSINLKYVPLCHTQLPAQDVRANYLCPTLVHKHLYLRNSIYIYICIYVCLWEILFPSGMQKKNFIYVYGELRTIALHISTPLFRICVHHLTQNAVSDRPSVRLSFRPLFGMAVSWLILCSDLVYRMPCF